MDQMDAQAQYEMSPRRVVFEYRANEEHRSAAISGDALELIAGGADLARGEQHVAVYREHWEAIHKVAAALHNEGRRPVVVRVGDV